VSAGYVDLHCHYVPAVDDGVRTLDEGMALLRGLHGLGYTTVTATPHIRSGMFDNAPSDLRARFAEVEAAVRESPDGMPALALGAEHFCDDHFWALWSAADAIPYSGGKALLLELPPERLPVGLADRCFRIRVQGVLPVIAHPERYAQLFDTTDALAQILEMGVPALLDLMSLEGKYGRKPRRAAERMLEEGAYAAACSDCHRPDDVAIVARAIERLRGLVGAREAEQLLAIGPARILRGEAGT
jgi:protein-tyrosine phosphatase